MEMRSKANKILQELLISAGVYEEGMEVEEMRQVAHAIELSTLQFRGTDNSNLERALVENEAGYEMMVNSTMIVQPTPESASMDANGPNIERECNSLCTGPEQMQVDAVVHHDQNWSPPSASCPLKGKADENDYFFKCITPRVVVDEDSFDPNAIPSNPQQIQVKAVVHHEQNWSPIRASCPIRDKSSHNDNCLKRPTSRPVEDEESFDPDATPMSIPNSDSGVSCELTGFLSSISESSSLPSIGEMPSRLLISTSSAAVSDQSEQCDMDFEDEDSH